MAEVTHELDAPPWRRFASTLMATSRAIRRAYDVRLRVVALNQSEASLLALVDEIGPTTQTELASRIGMRRAAVGAIIDGLEARRLVSRHADPDDRRTWLVQASAGAAETILQVRRIDEQLRTEMRQGISEAERTRLAETLERLQVNLATILAGDVE